jgi:hypothetical protein
MTYWLLGAARCWPVSCGTGPLRLVSLTKHGHVLHVVREHDLLRLDKRAEVEEVLNRLCVRLWMHLSRRGALQAHQRRNHLERSSSRLGAGTKSQLSLMTRGLVDEPLQLTQQLANSGTC